MFQNLAHRTRPAGSSGDDAAADPGRAVNHCTDGGTESSGGPLTRPNPATAGSQSHESLLSTHTFGPSDVQIARDQQQAESVLPAAGKALPDNATPSDFPSSSGSSWPSLSPMSSPSPSQPSAFDSHFPSLTSSSPPSLTSLSISHDKTSTSSRGRPKTKRSKFVKMDMSDFAPISGGPPDLDTNSESMYDSEGGADESLCGSYGSSHEITGNTYMAENISEDIPEEASAQVDDAANFVVRARAKDNSGGGSSMSRPGRRSFMHSSVQNRRGRVKSPIISSRGAARSGRGIPRSLPEDGGAGPSSSSGNFPIHAARGSGRITRRRANATSNGSIAQYSLKNARLGHASSLSARSHKFASPGILSLATEEAFPEIKDDMSDDAPDASETETGTIDKQAIWTALARIPGFAFPTLDVFLTEQHPWAVSWPAVEVDDSDDVDYDEARIQSINGVLRLGRREAALDRLGLVLASPKIKQVCGRSLQRTRLPSFLKYSLDEQSRVWAAEAAAAGRLSLLQRQGSTSNNTSNTSSAVSTRPLDTIEDALASRFKLGYLANFVSASIEMDIDTSTLTSAVPTHVDGPLAALVMQDMLSILSSAREAFNRNEAIDRAKGRGNGKDKGKGKAVATGSTTSKHQKQVLLAFNNAVQSKQMLQQLRCEMQQREAAANGDAPMEVDFFEKMKF
ncbi:hypothetical protein F503_03291 [Ophiostoma piceae UAMH 11346]|uniref:Uncharacterized protein n=1 Tax=Ophiostoma piceae (strain UAMH 11346) TaxID=1262450 RepID=S3C003_OPHP1|nr:hypothetical protein F503_03291 [Ophiostoma piceae UAMH 11346]